MRKSPIWKFISVAGISLTFCATAYSSPYVYEIQQSWVHNSDPTVFGTAAELFITVDNGASTNVNQIYTWQNITNIVYETVGGTYYLDSNGNQYSSLPNVSFLTTNGSGQGTLDVDNSGHNPAYFNTLKAGGGYAQFGAQVFTNIAYASNSSQQSIAKFEAAVDPDTNQMINWVTPAVFVQTSAAPEPTTMLLFGTGLAGLVVSRRKKKA